MGKDSLQLTSHPVGHRFVDLEKSARRCARRPRSAAARGANEFALASRRRGCGEFSKRGSFLSAMRRRSLALGSALVASLAGCALGPDFVPPAPPAVVGYLPPIGPSIARYRSRPASDCRRRHSWPLVGGVPFAAPQRSHRVRYRAQSRSSGRGGRGAHGTGGCRGAGRRALPVNRRELQSDAPGDPFEDAHHQRSERRRTSTACTRGSSPSPM